MNPFTEKALAARAKYERLRAPTTHDKAMAQSFPLGAGYGRPGAADRIERTIDRAVAAQAALRNAEWLEAQARAFDAGTINAQGRATNADARRRSDRRYTAAQKRQAKIDAAKDRCAGKEPWEIDPEMWADAHGYLSGSGRALVMADHAELIAKRDAA